MQAQLPFLTYNGNHTCIYIYIELVYGNGDYICLHTHGMFTLDGLMHNCSNSSGLAMELQQSCTGPTIYAWGHLFKFQVNCFVEHAYADSCM